MAQARLSNRLDRPVDQVRDHVLGAPDAEITLVEYGSYACPYCRVANEQIARVRDAFGDRLRYVFRHRPLTGSELARRAAELVEHTDDPKRFWDAHIELMTRSETLTEDDLRVVANDLGLAREDPAEAAEAARRASARVEADEQSARASGVTITPTFFINGRRYDGPWDESSLADAMLGRLGHRVRSAALDFASWGPSAGVLLLLATLLAVALTNSPLGPAFAALWEEEFGVVIGAAGFRMSLQHWVNDGLLTIFFLVVGLEIKREFTVGHLATWRAAALPVAAAIGGMVAPALLYLAVIPEGPWSHGWGVPMATDTAFAVALIVMLGERVPIGLRIFLTAAAIVDDIGAIVVVALFYSGDLHFGYLAAAVAISAALALLNRSHVYRVLPYALLGVALWACVHAAGLHATLAGVLLALFIPTRPPPNLAALMTQASTIVAAEASHGDEVLRHGPSLPALRALDAIHDRLGIAGGPSVAACRGALELLGPAAVRFGQCRSRTDRGRVLRTPAAAAGDPARADGRQAARPGRGVCARGRAAHRAQAGRVLLAPARGRWRARRHRLHHVAVHRRPGVPGAGRLRRRQGRGLRGLHRVGDHRRGAAVARPARRRQRRGRRAALVGGRRFSMRIEPAR